MFKISSNLEKKGVTPSFAEKSADFTLEAAKNFAKACVICLAVAFCFAGWADSKKKK